MESDPPAEAIIKPRRPSSWHGSHCPGTGTSPSFKLALRHSCPGTAATTTKAEETTRIQVVGLRALYQGQARRTPPPQEQGTSKAILNCRPRQAKIETKKHVKTLAPQSQGALNTASGSELKPLNLTACIRKPSKEQPEHQQRSTHKPSPWRQD